MGVFSTVNLFFTLALLISLLLALIVLIPWLFGNHHVLDKSLSSDKDVNNQSDNQLIDINIDVFQERLQELKEDKLAGVIDEQHYQNQKVELERQLLDAQQQTAVMQTPSIKSRLIILIWVPVLVAMSYLLISDRTPVFKLWQAQDHVGQVADDLLTGKIDMPPDWATKDSTALISAMQTNVHHHAYDPNRWMRLSELFLSLEATDSALEALARAHRLAPDDESIATTYAQISFFASGGNLNQTSRQILRQVLQKNPNHEGAQMLMAMGEARAGNYEQAQKWIDILSASIASKPGDHTQALNSLKELRENIAGQQAQAKQGITVDITVNPSLFPLIQANDVLFVAIRDSAGGPPFAVKRLPASQIEQGHLAVKLNNSDAMMPGRDLQTARNDNLRLVVTARISHSGNAMSQSGDLSANPVVLTKEQEQVNIEINQQVP